MSSLNEPPIQNDPPKQLEKDEPQDRRLAPPDFGRTDAKRSSKMRTSSQKPKQKKGELAADQHFDDLATPFASNIYGSYKGRLRLALLRDDLWPLLAPGQSLLDVGAGIAQLSAESLQLGLDAYALDAADEMRHQAEVHAQTQFNQQWGDRYQVLPMQSFELPEAHSAGFDWVWCHAVLAWLQDPADGLQRLVEWVRPGGRLSVLFYNRDSMALQQIFRGRYGYLEKLWARMEEGGVPSVGATTAAIPVTTMPVTTTPVTTTPVTTTSGTTTPVTAAQDTRMECKDTVVKRVRHEKDDTRAQPYPGAVPVKPFYPGGLTPQTPLDLQWVIDTVTKLGMRVVLQRGVRCFADYMQANVRARMSEAELLQVERTYRGRMPYLAMGRYIHLVAEK